MCNNYYDGFAYANFLSEGQVVISRYLCAHCREFERTFTILVSSAEDTLTKVGQFPAWEIRGDKNVEQLLGNHKTLLRRGLISESQGYGIGAFAYYRRIVEETIDQLLDEIPGLLSGEELAQYNDALAKTKTTRVTAEKIELVKDLLPQSLRPEGMNPLKILHETLSEGLHAESDEACMNSAEAVRNILSFLAGQIAAAAMAKKDFSEGMRALLDKKSKPKT